MIRRKVIVLMGLLIFGLLATITGMPHTIAQDDPPTPTTTPVPNLLLPDWVRDPDTQVLVMFAYEQNGSTALSTFINAATGERFILDWSYGDNVSWIQAVDGVYLRLGRNSSSGADDSEGFTEFIHLQSGELTRLPLRDERAPQDTRQLVTSVDNGAGLSVRMTVTSDITPPDSTGLSFVTSRLTLTLTDTSAQTLIREWMVSDSRVDQLSVQWFGGGAYLGVWTGRQTANGAVGSAVIYDTDARALIDFSDTRDVRWHQGDQPLLLYTATYPDVFFCWADIENHENNCQQLTQWQSRNNATIHAYDWSHDGDSIIFAYTDNDSASGGLCIARRNSPRAPTCPIARTVNAERFGASYTAAPSDTYGIYSYGGSVPDMYDTRTPRDRGLCVINRESLQATCLTDDTLPPDTYYSGYRWSPSGRYLAFLYTGQQYTGRDGVCIFDTRDESITCPVSGDDIIEGFIEVYSWSPDSRYLAFIYTGYGPLSDDKSFARFGILDVENGVYRDEGFAYFDYRLSERWRPPIE